MDIEATVSAILLVLGIWELAVGMGAGVELCH